ncbi:hypothetical protein CHA01nite_30840 [Chryseobacterium hagamense]|uniref:Acyltransferase 3 domain-containing protein n=2 Tax=Chryseobacterium hagamense TaxID=395935 RepID=A0A511YQ70_9FLAO|nr:hypothetical protein CHA01nite_30840 [Chryseobacterium hagamense]
MVLFAMVTPWILDFLNLSYSDKGYRPDWFLTLTFLENYKGMFEHQLPNVSPLTVIWSLCIEEHFYILWGLVFYFISLKNIPTLLAGCILFSFLMQTVYEKYGISTADLFTNIHYFAFGALPAYLFVFKNNLIEKLGRIPSVYKYTYAVLVLIAIVVIANTDLIPDPRLSSLIFSILFSALILSALSQKNAFRISDNSILAWLGKYTYGLYLFHTICIMLFSKIGIYMELDWITVTLLSFISSVFLSVLSYHFFEKQFLKFK